MLCSEVEIGVGHDNSGIILLDTATTKPGTPAAEYFGVSSDYVLEVDITPNRVDATSHYGVARDLAAYLTQQGKATKAKLPEVLPRTCRWYGLPRACHGRVSMRPFALASRGL